MSSEADMDATRGGRSFIKIAIVSADGLSKPSARFRPSTAATLEVRTSSTSPGFAPAMEYSAIRSSNSFEDRPNDTSSNARCTSAPDWPSTDRSTIEVGNMSQASTNNLIADPSRETPTNAWSPSLPSVQQPADGKIATTTATTATPVSNRLTIPATCIHDEWSLPTDTPASRLRRLCFFSLPTPDSISHRHKSHDSQRW